MNTQNQHNDDLDDNHLNIIFNDGVFVDKLITNERRFYNNIIPYVNEFIDDIKQKLTTQGMTFKYSISVKVVLIHSRDGEYKTFEILSKNGIQVRDIIDNDELEGIIVSLENEFENIGNRLRGSGWVIDSFVRIILHINEVNPLIGNLYVPLPFISNSIINVQNHDNKCFIWAILAYLYTPNRNPQRVSKYQNYLNTLKYNENQLPMTINGIKYFENENNLKINVYSIKCIDNVNKGLRKSWRTYPLYVSNKICDREKINLLLYENHYILIKNFKSWITSELNFTLRSNQDIFICERCLSINYYKNAFESHQRFCINNEPIKYIFPPKEKSTLNFTNYSYKIKLPFIMIVDIECLNIRNYDVPNSNEINTITRAIQKPSCLYLKIISEYPNLLENQDKLFTGPTCVKELAKYIVEIEPLFKKLLNTSITYIQESGDSDNFNNSNKCYYCNKKFETNDNKVLDHDHYNGRYRGAAHNDCNVNAKRPKFIPVFFHNGSRYDFHLIIKDLANEIEINESKNKNLLEVIGKTEEEYISFSYKKTIKFVDSLRFFLASLDSVSKSLSDEDNIHLMEFCKSINKENKFSLLKKKGIYPYEYFNDFEKYEQVELIPKQEFYSSLTQEGIKDEDYERYIKVYQKFNCRNHWDYTILYLKQDVILLSDCIQKFRTLFDLDPCHFVSSPSLT